MGVRFPSVASNTFIGPLPANANETVVLVSPPLTLPLDNATVILLWDSSILAGTGTTGVAYLIRRGTTTAGALVTVNSRAVAAAAGVARALGGTAFDIPGAVTGQQYCLTAQQTGATAAGVWQDGNLIAFVL